MFLPNLCAPWEGGKSSILYPTLTVDYFLNYLSLGLAAFCILCGLYLFLSTEFVYMIEILSLRMLSAGLK